jgi:chromosome segregation ATPase
MAARWPPEEPVDILLRLSTGGSAGSCGGGLCFTVGRGCGPEEGGLSVETRDASTRGDDLAGLGRKVSDQFVRGLATIDARFDRLDGEVAEIKTDLAGVKTEVAGVKTDLAGLKTEVAGVKTDLAGVKTEVAGVKADLAGFKTEVAARFDRLDGEVAEIKTDLAGFKTEVATRFDRVEADAAETRQQLNRLEQAHQLHADRVEARFDQLVGLIVRDETKGRGAQPR